MKVASRIVGLGLAVLVLVPMMTQPAQAQLGVGENAKLTAGGLVSFGYSGDYGDQIPSDHGLNFGLNGTVAGYYYNPNFLSFAATPYYNQSRADSDSQSITGASGVTGIANFFSGSHFPGSFTYHYDDNSTSTYGLAGQPNFTIHGSGQGFGINWSALVPDWPTLSVGYSQGSGHGTLYGTDQESDSSTRLFNVHSTYQISGWRLNGFFDHNSYNSEFPQFLENNGESVEDSSSNDLGFGTQHSLPLHGSFTANYSRASTSSDYLASEEQTGSTSNNSNYTASTETATANFNPIKKLSFNLNESYTDNLSGYLAQSLSGNGVAPPGVNLGTGSKSFTMGGGLAYQFTNYLAGSAQATYYDQFYFGHSYTGEYLSGTLDYNKRLWNMFSFSGTVIDSSNGQGQNAVGFAGNVNFFHNFRGWVTDGQFIYAQNVQTMLITYTTSYYQYNAQLHHNLTDHIKWTASFSGNHSGLTNNPGDNNHSESYSTGLSMRRLTFNGFYSQSSGVSLLGAGGLVVPTPTPGLTNLLFFTGSDYGGGFAVTPLRRLSISGSYSRAISNTLASTVSHNDTEVINAQMQYHLRKIGLQAGYLRFTQGISAIGAPVNTTSFYVGMTRWFDFF
jgi:hypothetical protein